MNKVIKIVRQCKLKNNKIFKIIVKAFLLLVLPTFATLFLAVNLINILLLDKPQKCTDITSELEKNIDFKITNNGVLQQSVCYEFSAQSGDTLILDTNTKINLIKPNQQSYSFQGNYQETLLQEGRYSIRVLNKDYKISLKIVSEDRTRQQESLLDSSLPSIPQIDNYLPTKQVFYNSVTAPTFSKNDKLQKIVDNIVHTARSRGLPTDRLSISLVDLSSKKCCAYASFQDRSPRYPASVVKLFWLVALFGQYNANIIPTTTVSSQKLEKMIVDSDNEAGSWILDEITQTKSSKQKLNSSEINQWIAKRYWVNQFFYQAGYRNLNISQKTFPIPYIKLDKPEGADLQMREIYGEKHSPIRNFVTTNNVTRLLFEIDRDLAISPSYSQKIKQLLNRDLNPQAWQNKPYNAIKSFLGEGLPPDTEFYSKMGWTFSNRNDSAIIANPDGKVRYILVVFGDDNKFYEDKNFFPTISKIVYQKMLDIHTGESK